MCYRAVNATITKLKDCARRFNIDFKFKVPVDSGSIRSMSNCKEIECATQVTDVTCVACDTEIACDAKDTC